MFQELDSSPQARILRARVVKASVDKKARGKTRRTLYQEEGVPDQDAKLEQTLREYPRDFFVLAPDSTPDPVFRRESPVFEQQIQYPVQNLRYSNQQQQYSKSRLPQQLSRLHNRIQNLIVFIISSDYQE